MKPLEDVRILAIEQYGAGPFGSLQLADLGADVIKLEDPGSGGDVGRYVVPMQHGEDSVFFEVFNRNKRSLSLDLNAPAGREVFNELVKVSDVVFSNLRGDVPAKLGIRYVDLKDINPAIVCCSLSGFGMTGPRSAEPGYDYIMQGIAGWMSLTGEPHGAPTKSGLSVVDYSGGLVAAISILAALHASRRDGVGCDCDVSLFDTAVAMLTYPAGWALNSDFEPARTHHSAHPSLVPFQVFRSADEWIVVACPKEKFWRRLAGVIGRPDLAEDDRFGTFEARHRNSVDLLTLLDSVFVTRTSDDWLAALKAAGVPCGPVNSVRDALADPQTLARDMLVSIEHPDFGTVIQVASAVRVGNERIDQRRAPRRHEHADAILAGLLGYTSTQVEQRAAQGAFGAADGLPGSDAH
ncbi:CaiB/BaiF CoA transferase family protein [Nocardioides allogilvus]|uniref:CaiB/BaiF CoA transferase family protein n=1 Tax=Nocardioides allogilvus TaxID=2072017 RepID=UPI000D31FD33|nr:CoA transferase [Nocardioides allogilvus]